MRVFYYIINYFLIYLIFLIKIKAGDETLKRGFHSSFFLLLFIRGPPILSNVKSV